jgi:hypothetical protein
MVLAVMTLPMFYDAFAFRPLWWKCSMEQGQNRLRTSFLKTPNFGLIMGMGYKT